jgi:hypothetical protein
MSDSEIDIPLYVRYHKKHYDVIIHQPGRVASKSIKKFLIDRRYRVINIHILSTKNQERYKGLFDRLYISQSVFKETHSIYRTIHNDFNKFGVKQKVISAVREPIDYAISAFFYNLHNYSTAIGFLESDTYIDKFKKLKEFYHRICDQYMSFDSDKEVIGSIPIFERRAMNYFYWPIHFFDHEMEDPWKIDIFKVPFDGSYKIYNSDICELLLIKYEKIKEYFPKAIFQFMGIRDGTLNYTVRSLKSCGEEQYVLSEMFKKDIFFSPEFLNKIYSSQYVRYFYSESDIEEFKKKWSKKYVL